MNASNCIENAYATIWEEDGIIWGVYKPHVQITLDIAKKLVADRHLISDGITRPMIIDIRNLAYADDTARKYLAGEKGARFISAGALIVDSPIPIFLANLFISVNAPPVPTKAFKDLKKAVKWLQKYK